MVGALSGSASAAGLKGAASQLQAQLLNSGDLANFLNNPDGVTNNNLPRAYLNWLFFDENFDPIASDATTGNGSGAMRVTGSGDWQISCSIRYKSACQRICFRVCK
ncbi:hypothetical protein QTN47_22595 [Danxiaibacter flavus]|uniref:Uncharacterized protein n=1 Tax=Danxiaibacter flavus TaxID=3049108 RepID=A0ABV3ZKA2_9BACT|nr:hypothetical protein QNM32_22600 [Chitinophagaceae bacterium DXS]